jgi:hypothetical protein
MTHEELETLCRAWFGKGWQRRLAAALDIKRSTVYRWEGKEIPGPVAAAVQCWQKAGGPPQ